MQTAFKVLRPFCIRFHKALHLNEGKIRYFIYNSVKACLHTLTKPKAWTGSPHSAGFSHAGLCTSIRP